MQPKIEEHDLSFKTKHIKQFLQEGYKVKVTVRFRGRELAHTELGLDVLNRVLELLADTFVVDKPPQNGGAVDVDVCKPQDEKIGKDQSKCRN